MSDAEFYFCNLSNFLFQLASHSVTLVFWIGSINFESFDLYAFRTAPIYVTNLLPYAERFSEYHIAYIPKYMQ